MTEREWLQVAQYLDAGWTQPLDEAREDVYRQELGHRPYGLVMDAIRRAALNGNPAFRPGVLEVVAALTGPDQVPTLDDVIDLYRRSLTIGHADQSAGLTWIADRDEVAALAISQIGYRQFGLEHIDDPDHGGAVRHRLTQVLTDACREHTASPQLTAGRIRRRLHRAPAPAGNAISRLADSLRPAEELTA